VGELGGNQKGFGGHFVIAVGIGGWHGPLVHPDAIINRVPSGNGPLLAQQLWAD
jgi:hypothetical protein